MSKPFHDNLMHSLGALSSKIKGKKKYKGFFSRGKKWDWRSGVNTEAVLFIFRNISFDKYTISDYFINHCILAQCHHWSSSTKPGKHSSTTNAIWLQATKSWLQLHFQGVLTQMKHLNHHYFNSQNISPPQICINPLQKYFNSGGKSKNIYIFSLFLLEILSFVLDHPLRFL